ncbi:olfactory receptor 4C11-like [Sardina pilchardus]|uniref:olfactory receptor 4C11-like n=1 Tax=Sardina pilchardus TaxID=27697 RepID=UPI002E0D7277
MNQHKYLYFTLFFLIYIVTIALNTSLITVVYKKKTLHEPMHIFILAWLFPFCSFAMYLSLTLRLTLCGNNIYKTHCTNFDLIKLSCHDTSVNNIVGILLLGVYMFPQFFVILFSYAQILRICLHASKECRKKALQTCIPHLLTFINYFFAGCFELIQCT